MINLNFMQDISDVSTLSQLKSIILKNINLYDVNNFNYGIKLPSINSVEKPYIFSGYDLKWINHYKTNRLIFHQKYILMRFERNHYKA